MPAVLRQRTSCPFGLSAFLLYTLFAEACWGTVPADFVDQHRLRGEKIFGFRNILDVTYGAYVVNGAYKPVSNSTGVPKHNDAVAIIRELLRGNTADVRQSAREASTAISIVQTFSAAADSIGGKLAAMESLVKKASSAIYTRAQVEDMQEELKDLAEEINAIADSTDVDSIEYDYNKLFSAEGESMSIPVGNGCKIDLFAKDLSFDADGVDLTADPAGALSRIEAAGKSLNEYNEYFIRQAARLEDATARIERKLESAMGVDMSDFDVDVARQAASNAKGRILEDASMLAYTQARATPSRVLRLLEDKGSAVLDD